LSLFGFQFQPSEFAKIFVLLALSDFLSRNLPKVGEGLSIITTLFIILPPILLVILEPDLGTSLCFVPILLGVMIMGNVSMGGIVKVVAVGLAVMPLGWFFLKDYQKERILSFLNPSSDVLGQGYQSYQAKIAVGSGGMAGKGFFSGTQNMLGLIPGQHTDFIFTVLAEEKGFIGSIILLALFATLFLRAVQIAYRSNDSLARMIIGGVLGWLSFQVFINIGVSLGIMPVTGIPLPLVSYGGSSLLSSLVAVGLILSVHNFSPKYGRLG
jgi:rod shape determining protein RodA